MNYFSFNKVYIIRSIRPSDVALKAPGDVLFNDLIQMGVPCELHDISTGLVGFNQVMNKIAGECITQDAKPIIHFICHGAEPNKKYPKGAMALYSLTGGYVAYSWDIILQLLEHINLVSEFNLFVSMCVCHGFYSLLRLLDENRRIPFCGILASPDPVSVASAKIAFSSFYNSLISNLDVTKAIDDLRISIAPLKQWYDNNHIPMEEYLVLFTDDMFTKAARDDFRRNRSTLFKLWQLGEKMFSHINNKNRRISIITSFVKENIAKYPVIFKNIRDYKFMLDLYPHQRGRFDLPKGIKDLM